MIWRSKRPGRNSAGSRTSGRLRGRDDDHAFLRIEAVHLDEQRIERLLALVVAAAHAVTAMTPDRVDFIDKDDARRGFLALLEHVAHARGADADKHFNKIRAADRKNGTSASPAIARASKVLPVPGGPTRRTPLGMRPPSFWNFSDHAGTRRALALHPLLPRPRRHREM